VARKTQQVASWSRDGVSRGSRYAVRGTRCVRHSSGHVFDPSLR